jgi:hypothetical protein
MPGPGRRFQKGCTGGPGRPPKHVEEAFVDACRQALTPEALRKLLERLLSRADSWGGERAAAILLRLVFGDKPLLPKLVADGRTTNGEATDGVTTPAPDAALPAAPPAVIVGGAGQPSAAGAAPAARPADP